MKSRGNVVCACPCGSPIPAGTHVSRYAGRLWRTDHLIEYRRQRHGQPVRAGTA
jgi:hypothetical protein